ncbi:hypothetical protein [Patulibacter minatonensis]|uniref:hypothetical protein n=1 Tax=Patulibacter minatonensis TaxID=298163 RepID=UPI000479EAF1|nr:hypothetical protein [Patulibacter minatonensis]
MSTVWVVSAVLAWAVIALLVAVVLALLRQTAELRLRLDELDGGDVLDVPEWDAEEGDPVPTATVRLLPGSAPADGDRVLELGGERDTGTLLVFHAPGCAGCVGVEEDLETLRDEGSPVRLVSVVVLREDDAAAHLRRRPLHGIPAVSIDVLPRELRRATTPSALGISPDGIVAAIDRPDGIERLRAIALRTAATHDVAAP